MAYIRQHIPLEPPLNRREARVAVETVGFIPIAMQHIIPLVPNAMFINHVRAPPEDGVPVIRARDAVDVDATSDGPVPVVLSEELREFDLIDSESRESGRTVVRALHRGCCTGQHCCWGQPGQSISLASGEQGSCRKEDGQYQGLLNRTGHSKLRGGAESEGAAQGTED